MLNMRRIASMIMLTTLLGSCASIKMPDMDFIKFPEFKSEAENIPDYPKVEDAPQKPKGLRTAEKWDQAAQDILARKDSFREPDLVDVKSDAEIVREIQRLRAEADAYKKDDPQ